MMREFNTSGPCDPNKHYTVMREALVAKGKTMVEQGRYFTIFAPRQAGKTTYFQLLIERLKEEGVYTPIWISFEGLKTVSKGEFYRIVVHRIREAFTQYPLHIDKPIKNHSGLAEVFREIHRYAENIVLVIDNFEDIPGCVVSELMHTFRMIYHRKQHYGLYSLLLVGVCHIVLLAEESPEAWNVIDNLNLPYFSYEEVQELIRQYILESGQAFEESAIKAIYENTHGQPGLVGTLCVCIVEKIATDRNLSVSKNHLYAGLKHLLSEPFNEHLQNIVEKAKLKQDLMRRYLFSDLPSTFHMYNADIAYLQAHGLIDNNNGWVTLPVPLYSKALITAFRSLPAELKD